MQINQINQTYYSKQPSFGYWKRDVVVPGKGLVNRNDTSFFREANFFPRLTKMLSEKFKNAPKVNVYSFGCSDGSEAFTFAMRMLTMIGEENPQKFFPIIARDIDPVAIQKAINNDYKIIKKEKDYIDHFTHGQYKRFFYEPYGEPTNGGEGTQVFVRKELYDSVDFHIGNILKDYKKIEPKNSVIMAGNFWPYIEKSSTRLKFFRDLYKHLDSGCYLVTGEFDHRGTYYKLSNEIIDAGFRGTPIDYVYVKE